MKPALTMVVLAAAMVLAACGEHPQNLGNAPKGSSPAWQGTNNGFSTSGWKAGDKTSWDKQIQDRAVGQNDYVRIGG